MTSPELNNLIYKNYKSTTTYLHDRQCMYLSGFTVIYCDRQWHLVLTWQCNAKPYTDYTDV